MGRLLDVVAEPPLDPSGVQGRRLLGEELDKLAYSHEPSLLERLQAWIMEQLGKAIGPTAGLTTQVILLVVLAVLVALILFAASRVRATRRARQGGAEGGAVLTEQHVSADEYRRRARAADARGEHDAALLDWFRAIARSGDERALLGDLPARTAHELVRALGRFFPTERAALVQAGDVFDDVRYGDRRVAAPESATVRDLDERLRKARPQHQQDVEGEQLVSPGRWAP